jgi:hypothetical protein
MGEVGEMGVVMAAVKVMELTVRMGIVAGAGVAREVAARGEAMARAEVVVRGEAGLKPEGDLRLFPVGVSNHGVSVWTCCVVIVYV